MRKCFSVLIIFGLLLLLLLASIRKRPPRPPLSHPSLAFKKDPRVGFYLAIAGEELGYLEPCGCSEGLLGGISRRDSLLQYLSSQKTPVVHLAMGNSINHPGLQAEIKLSSLKRALNLMGCKAYSMGPKELSMFSSFQRIFGHTPFPVLCANLYQTGRPVFPESALVNTKAGVTLGVISALSPSYAELALLQGLELKSLEETLPPLIQKLRKKVNVLVLLFQGSKEESVTLLRRYPLVDVFISAQESVYPHFIEGKENVLVINSRKGKYMTILGWNLEKGLRLVSKKGIPLNDFIPDSQKMVTVYQDYVQRILEAGLPRPSPIPTTGGSFEGSERCFSCHKHIRAEEIWRKSAHSHAFETLKKKGQHKNPECLECHTVGYRFVSGFDSEALTPQLKNVGCESCHGPGSNHNKNPQRGYGKVGVGICLKCHTAENSPKFDFKKYHPKIDHREKKKN